MVAQPDRRCERTREALLSAFLKLLFAHGYPAMTVADIVSAANVGRSTFYEHFTGKDDMLKFSLRRPFSVLADVVGAAQPNERTMRLLAHFRENRKLGPALFSWPVRPLLTRALSELIEQRLSALYASPAAQTPMVPRRLMAQQVAQAQLVLLENWVSGKIACRLEATAEALHATTNAMTRALYRAEALA